MTNENKGKIATVIAVVAGVGSVGLAIHGTIKATRKINELPEDEKPEGFIETFKVTWKCYLPTGIALITSIAAACASEKMNLDIIANLSSLVNAGELALTCTNKLMEETVGKEKADEIKKIVQEKKTEELVKNESVPIPVRTYRGDDIFMEPLTGQMFYSSMDAIEEAVKHINRQIDSDVDGFASHNDFLEELGINKSAFYEEYGWTPNRKLELDMSGRNGFYDGKLKKSIILLNYRYAPVNRDRYEEGSINDPYCNY